MEPTCSHASVNIFKNTKRKNNIYKEQIANPKQNRQDEVNLFY